MGLYKKAGTSYSSAWAPSRQLRSLELETPQMERRKMGPHRDVVGQWQKAAKELGVAIRRLRTLVPASPGSRAAIAPTRPARWQAFPTTAPTRGGRTCIISRPQPTTRAGTARTEVAAQSFGEIKELVDNYQPDLLYTDGGVAFGNEVGLSMIAHLYNTKPDAVYNCKQKSEGRWVEDLERGIMPKIDPYPWQTDTSIGDWFYNRDWKFRPVSWVIHMLVETSARTATCSSTWCSVPTARSTRGRTDARRAGRVERGPRRSDLRLAALAGLRRRRHSEPRAATSRKTSNTPPGISASPPKATRSTPSRWAGRKTTCWW